MKTFPIVRELPPAYLQGIGRVCFEWALQEHALTIITYYLLNIGPKHGRVAVRNPRADDQVNMIKQLMFLEQVEVPSVNLNALCIDLQKLKSMRDLVAHGIWFQADDKKYMVRNVSGNWNQNPKIGKVSKRIVPEGKTISENWLQELANRIQFATTNTEEFGQLLRVELDTLRGKRP